MIKCAVLQWRIVFGKVEENKRKLLSFIEPLEDALVVLPEMFLCGFDYESLREHAKSCKEVLEELKELSQSKKLTLVGTYPEERSGKFYNTAFVISDGKLVGKRDKIKLFPIYKEGEYFCAGEGNPVFETRHGRLGILICFELRFASLGWELRKKNVEIIAVPSMWGVKRKDHLKVLSRARAVELQSFLMLSNAWGETGGEDYAGCSAIYDPWGEILSFSESGECLLLIQADTKKVEMVRRVIPVIDD